MSIAVNRARRLASQVSRTFPGTDLALWAAGATFFGVIGLVPLAMASLWTAGLLVGQDTVTSSMDTAISAEERAGIFYVSPASRYSFSHPQSTGHADSPFHAIWFCGGWASDKERRRAMRALKPLRQSGRVECFRSAAMLKRRGHFAKRSE